MPVLPDRAGSKIFVPGEQLSNLHSVGESGKGEDRMKVLIACEESQTVCAEFRRIGHEMVGV